MVNVRLSVLICKVAVTVCYCCSSWFLHTAAELLPWCLTACKQHVTRVSLSDNTAHLHILIVISVCEYITIYIVICYISKKSGRTADFHYWLWHWLTELRMTLDIDIKHFSFRFQVNKKLWPFFTLYYTVRVQYVRTEWTLFWKEDSI